MADSLPVAPFGLPVFPDIPVTDDVPVPDDLPVLPPEIYLMIAREYRLATVEDRDASGWWQVRMEMGYLPRCPKRKRVINLKGFGVPRHGNLLQPVTGYFYRSLIRRMFVTKERDPQLYRWFRKTFGEDDYLRSNQAVDWPFIYCHYCHAVHECANEKEDEEWEYRREQPVLPVLPVLPEENAACGPNATGSRDSALAAPRPKPSPPFNFYQGPPLGSRPHLQKSMINTQIKKHILLIIARVARVAPGLARSACKLLGIDLAGEGASRCDRNALAIHVECVRGDTRPRCDSRRGVAGDDTRHS